MGLLDVFKKKEPEQPSVGERAADRTIGAISGLQGPPGLTPPPGMGRTQQGFQQMPATPIYPQTQQINPAAPFQEPAFSPAAELREAQAFPQSQQPQQVTQPSDDIAKRIDHLEDKVEIMNEKLDLILRELRNMYERSVGRRV